MPVIQIATPFNIDLEFEIADFPRRFFAYAIDFTLLIIYTYGMRYVIHGTLDYMYLEPFDPEMCKDVIFVSTPMLFYSLLCELWMNGQTIGKKILNIKVISLDGGEPTLGQYLSRWITKIYELPMILGMAAGYSLFPNPLPGIISTAFLGIIVIVIIAISKKSQRLGDMVAGTVVVNTKSKLTVHDTIFMNIAQPDYKVRFPEALRLSDRDINTIKNVITQTQKSNNYDMCNRVSMKVQEVLNIQNDMYSMDFLEKIIADYNYLATRE